MFVFGSYDEKFVAIPVHQITKVLFTPARKGPPPHDADLQVETTGSGSWYFKGKEAEAAWGLLTKDGYGLAKKP
jgi:hypothetical protein